MLEKALEYELSHLLATVSQSGMGDGGLGGGARASLTLARNGLVVGLLDGTLARVNFDGAVAWSIKLDGSIFAPAAIADGALYVPLQRGRIVKVR